jgi:hypothetical protein
MVKAILIGRGQTCNQDRPVADANLGTATMNPSVQQYRGQHLTASREGDGWHVQIGSTGFKTGLHSKPEGAFEDARRFVDKISSRSSTPELGRPGLSVLVSASHANEHGA